MSLLDDANGCDEPIEMASKSRGIWAAFGVCLGTETRLVTQNSTLSSACQKEESHCLVECE